MTQTAIFYPAPLNLTPIWRAPPSSPRIESPQLLITYFHPCAKSPPQSPHHFQIKFLFPTNLFRFQVLTGSFISPTHPSLHPTPPQCQPGIPGICNWPSPKNPNPPKIIINYQPAKYSSQYKNHKFSDALWIFSQPLPRPLLVTFHTW